MSEPGSRCSGAWPAVLTGHAALLADGIGSERADIDIAVEKERRLVRRSGVIVHRRSGVLSRARRHLSPPRVTVEEAAIEVAVSADWVEAAATVMSVCGARLTTPARLREELARRPRVSRRPDLLGLVNDAESGTHSVLEREYLVQVERPHGLPPAIRQQRVSQAGRTRYRDVDYGYGIVELDGRQHVTSWALDLGRDLEAAAVDGQQTVRLGWHQAVRTPCATADRIAAFLQRHGWQGRPTRCGPECAVGSFAATW